MEYKINGDNLEVVSLQLGGNEMVFGEAGSMSYMSGNIKMETEASGGFMQGLKRKFSGESFFVTQFTATGGTGIVAFSGQSPGRIVPLKLQPGVEYIAQKDAFLCAESDVDLDIEAKGLGKGLFGGEGMILQRLSGTGLAFIHVPGDLIKKELEPNEVLKVSTGNVAAFETSVNYDVQRTGGIKSSLFSGEGLFMTTLRGPGKVWLQSMTLQDLGAALTPYVSGGSGGSSGSDGPDISFG